MPTAPPGGAFRSRAAGTRLAPEIELLLCCARVELAPEHRQRIAQLLEGEIDWERLVREARWHRMLPLLCWHLERSEGGERHREDLAGLRSLFLANARYSLHLVRALLDVQRRFAEAGVPMVAYKGPVLAAQLYGNVALRQLVDLDVLVRRTDVPRARQLLHAHGFPTWGEEPGEDAGEHLERGYCELFRRADGVVLELHWAFGKREMGFPLAFEDVAARLEPVRVGGAEVASFGREDLLLILCAHGAKHRWERLEWLCGVAELLRKPEPLDWDGVRARAARLRSRRTLLLGMYLAHEILGAPLPRPVLEEAKRQRWLAALVADVRSRLLTEDGLHASRMLTPLGHNLFHLRLRDRARDRLRYLLLRLAAPERPGGWWSVLRGALRLRSPRGLAS